METFNAKYVSSLLFKNFWLSMDTGNKTPGENFTKAELELILLYNKQPDGYVDTYLLEVEAALKAGDYKNGDE